MCFRRFNVTFPFKRDANSNYTYIYIDENQFSNDFRKYLEKNLILL